MCDTGSVKLSIPSIVPDVRSTVVKSKTGDTCTSDKNNTCLTESLHSDVLVRPLVSASRNELPSASSVGSVDRRPIDLCPLQLPDDLTFTRYHEDYFKCQDEKTAQYISESMRGQLSEIVKPGMDVKISLYDSSANEYVHGAIVEECIFLFKLSNDCWFYYATAKVKVRLLDNSQIREVQFRDLFV